MRRHSSGGDSSWEAQPFQVSPFQGPNSRYTREKNDKMKEKEKDKNRREDFWPPTWGAGIKPYENEIVLTSNQLELPRSGWSRAETFIGGRCWRFPT